MFLGSCRQKSEVTQNAWIWPLQAFKNKGDFIRSKLEVLLEVDKWLSGHLKRLPLEKPAGGLQCLQPRTHGARGCLGEERQMREPSLLKPLPSSKCEANEAAPFQGTSTPSQPVCLFIARMEIINTS